MCDVRVALQSFCGIQGGKTVKKLIVITLICIILTQTVGVIFAQEEVFSATYTVIDKYESYDSATEDEERILSNSKGYYVMFNPQDYQTFEVDISEDGNYSIVVLAGCADSTDASTTILVDSGSGFVEKSTKSITKSGNLINTKETPMGVMEFTAGTHYVKVLQNEGTITFKSIRIEQIVGFELEEVKVNDTTLTDGATLPRGIDSFEIMFSQSVNEDSINNESIKLTKGDEIIPVAFDINGNKVVVNLKQTLQYDTDYSLTINRVEDSFQTSAITNIVYSLSTCADSGSDEGISVISDLSADIAGDTVSISGALCGSGNVGISGRAIKAYIEDTEGNRSDEPIFEGLSGENGLFEFEYIFSAEDVSGEYAFVIDAEYMTEEKNIMVEFDAEEIKKALNQNITVKESIVSYNNADGKPEQFGSANDIPFIILNNMDYQIFEVNIPKDGSYGFTIVAGCASTYVSSFAVLIDKGDGLGFVQVANKEAIKTPSFTVFTENPMSSIELKKGKIQVKVLGTKGDTYFSSINVDYVKIPEVSNVKTNETELNSGDTIPRGSDFFKLTFDQNLNTDIITKNHIQLIANNKQIPIEFEANNKEISVYCMETLPYDAECAFNISGLKDCFDLFSMPEYVFEFKTGSRDGDEGVESIGNLEITNVYGNIQISGVIYGSHGKTIAGRIVYIAYEDPEGNTCSDAVQPIISGSDGAFIINYNLPDESISGLYKFNVSGAYMTAPAQCSSCYVSEEYEKQILSEILSSQNASDISETLTTYENMIDISIADDMAEVSNPDKVYEHLAGKSFDTIADFKEDYYTFIALEIINQAGTPDKVASVLENDSYCAYLGIDKTRTDLIQKYRSSFITDVYNMPVISDIDEFLSEVYDISGTWLCKEFEKGKINSSAEDKSVYVGQGILVELGYEEEISDASKMVFYIETEEIGIFEGAKVNLDIKGRYEISKKDNVLTVEIYPNKILNNVKNVGVLYLVATDKTGTVPVKIKGITEYKLEMDNSYMLDLKTDMNEKEISVKINKKSSSSGGGGGAVSSYDSGKSKNEGNEIVAPLPTPNDTTEFSFDDIANVKWAENSITELLKIGVISQSENKKFEPDRFVTRAEFIKMIVTSLNLLDETAESSFVDVDVNNWSYKYVASAQSKGLIFGNDAGEFSPDSAVTREDASTIIYRAIKNNEVSIETQKYNDDSDIAEYAKEAVYALKEQGILIGTGDNLFTPKTNLTRAMAAVVVFRMLGM